MGILGLVMVLVATSFAAPSASLAEEREAGLARLSLSFVPNEGQTHASVRFQARAMGGTVFFRGGDVVLALPSKVARLRFEGANPEPSVIGIEPLPGTVSYFVGDDPAAWRAGLRTYGGIVYKDLYPGIDLRYDGTGGQLKSTYVVAPGAAPSVIRWRYEGAESVRLDRATGDLLVDLGGSALRERAPVAWQELGGKRVSVSVSYVLDDDGQIGLELGSFDASLPLVIDPTITYSTYLGGSGFDEADGIGVDGDGNMYVVGATTSPDFPGAAPGDYSAEEDTFVTKIDAAGNAVLYTVILGGSGDDDGNSIAVDAAGNAYVSGETDSTDFPTLNAVQGTLGGVDDVFVAKLDADGILVYSTYLGGSGVDETETITTDGAGNAYVGGVTFSGGWLAGSAIPYAGQGDAFVIKLNADGSWGYGNYLGGSGYDWGGWGIAVDGSGDVYLAGDTFSDDFPTLSALQGSYGGDGDAFVAKFNAAGDTLLYSTYLGGSGKDYCYGMAVDGGGNAVVTGQTGSADFPTTVGAYDTTCGTDGTCDADVIFGHDFGDAFAAKVAAGGDSLLFSTYLGGKDLEKGYAVALDGAGNAYITGDTFSPDFPSSRLPWLLTEPDAFILKLAVDGGYEYGFHLGGSFGDWGTGIAVGGDGSICVSGMTVSEDFPTTANALQREHAGGYADGFVVKLESLAVGGATLSPDSVLILVPWVGLGTAFALALLGWRVLVMRKRLN
jgi:hypothetical protein